MNNYEVTYRRSYKSNDNKTEIQYGLISKVNATTQAQAVAKFFRLNMFTPETQNVVITKIKAI